VQLKGEILQEATKPEVSLVIMMSEYKIEIQFWHLNNYILVSEDANVNLTSIEMRDQRPRYEADFLRAHLPFVRLRNG